MPMTKSERREWEKSLSEQLDAARLNFTGPAGPGFFAKALSKVGVSLPAMRFPRGGLRQLIMPRSNFNYEREVGDGSGSSTVMAPLNWIARNFPSAPIELKQILADNQEEVVMNHPMVELIHKPNDHYTGSTLWMATILDYNLSGNAYWIKVRNKVGGLAELWWVPSTLIEPRESPTGDTSVFIDHYDYRPNGEKIELDPEDVVHFRYGIDPENQKKGRSPLKSVLREIFTDDEAANYTAAILRNMGVPGVIVSPKGEGAELGDTKAMKERFMKGHTGDKRGEPFVASEPIEVSTLGFSPEEMNLKALRTVPEARVCAVLGISPMVVNLIAGLERSTFSNMGEARKAAYEENIIPAQQLLSEDIRFQLLPDFEPNPANYKVGFDTSKVQVLQEDRNKKAERLDVGVRGGWIKRSEARREMGFDATEDDEVYLVPINLTEVREGEAPEELGEGEKRRGTKGLKGKQQPYQQAIVKALRRNEERLTKALRDELHQDFHSLGAKVAKAFEEKVSDPIAETKGRDDVEVKLSDEANAHQVVIAAGVGAWAKSVYKKRLEANAGRSLSQTHDIVGKSLDVEIELPSSVESQILHKGGTREGLTDIEGQTKEAILRAIAKGREDGLDNKAIADLIKSEVPKGRYVKAGSEYRAETIARTETKFASNISSLSVYRASEHIKEAIAFDGGSDEICAGRDGTTMSFEEAEAEAASEHPNGNLSFAPVVNS